MTLEIRPTQDCAYDVVSLGEVMLRLDPGDGRICTARRFDVWEGGGEYNVARGLRRCFDQRAGVVTALADNEVGWLIEDFILQGGVDTGLIQWVQADSAGRQVRNGLNFTERGYGLRGAKGVADRGHTAASQMKPGDIDWEHLFGNLGVRWFHTGGIYAALSETSADVAVEAIDAAKRHGTIVSYDLNYRPSLWSSYGGIGRAQEINTHLAGNVRVACPPLTCAHIGSEQRAAAADRRIARRAPPGSRQRRDRRRDAAVRSSHVAPDSTPTS
jgi:2-dehydro-3-deoxygluconokinase